MNFITSFLPLIPVIVTFFGILRKKRIFFLLVYTLYSLMVIPAELISFSSSGEFIHLLVAALWLAQLIIAFPNKLNYDGSKVYELFALKLFISLMVINIIGIFIVLNDPLVNNVCVYYHALLAFFPLVAAYLMFTNKIPIQENE
jgi:hypothetical protein